MIEYFLQVLRPLKLMLSMLAAYPSFGFSSSESLEVESFKMSSIDQLLTIGSFSMA